MFPRVSSRFKSFKLESNFIIYNRNFIILVILILSQLLYKMKLSLKTAITASKSNFANTFAKANAAVFVMALLSSRSTSYSQVSLREYLLDLATYITQIIIAITKSLAIIIAIIKNFANNNCNSIISVSCKIETL